MIRSKRGVAVLGACGLIIGLIALSTSAVHAEKGANWMVEGKAVTAELKPQVIISAVVSDMVLLTKTAGVSVQLLCKGAEFISALLEPEGKVGGGNKVKFTGCQTKINGVTSAPCEPNNGGKGVFVSNALKGLLVLFELGGGTKDTLILFEPVTGESFATINFSEECSIGGQCIIIGKNSVKDVNGEFGVEKVEHTVEQGPINELWINSKTAEHVASVDGSARLALSGEHLGKKWSGVPG